MSAKTTPSHTLPDSRQGRRSLTVDLIFLFKLTHVFLLKVILKSKCYTLWNTENQFSLPKIERDSKNKYKGGKLLNYNQIWYYAGGLAWEASSVCQGWRNQ